MEISTNTLLAVIAFTTIAMSIDLKERRIPNWLTVSAASGGLVWNIITQGWDGLLLSLGGFGTGFGILLLLWLIGGGGGGDVKLMGAIGAWLGALPTLIVFLSSAGFAILCASGMILWSRTRQNGSGESEGSVLKQSVPYALPVAMSLWALLLVHVAGIELH